MTGAGVPRGRTPHARCDQQGGAPTPPRIGAVSPSAARPTGRSRPPPPPGRGPGDAVTSPTAPARCTPAARRPPPGRRPPRRTPGAPRTPGSTVRGDGTSLLPAERVRGLGGGFRVVSGCCQIRSFRARRVRIDSTVIEADVKYPVPGRPWPGGAWAREAEAGKLAKLAERFQAQVHWGPAPDRQPPPRRRSAAAEAPSVGPIERIVARYYDGVARAGPRPPGSAAPARASAPADPRRHPGTPRELGADWCCTRVRPQHPPARSCICLAIGERQRRVRVRHRSLPLDGPQAPRDLAHRSAGAPGKRRRRRWR
jgi:hypothetical protein